MHFSGPPYLTSEGASERTRQGAGALREDLHKQTLVCVGMDTQAVVARFEAKRQALAMLDHPHIAKVLGRAA